MMAGTHEAHDELEERRQAELAFVSSAYCPEEAWWDSNVDKGIISSQIQVHRRLTLVDPTATASITAILTLTMAAEYPVVVPLMLSFSLEPGSGNASLTKAAFNGMPHLIASCTEVAQELLGQEAVFAVLSHADEWIAEQWPLFCMSTPTVTLDSTNAARQNKKNNNVLGRRLIYSHHIISKIKRANLKELASHYQLTGYVKIGWPGLIIIEGSEQDCQYFYDDIKQWAWKYLVVRGEQQEKGSVEALRKFAFFLEVSDMSLVADHCRRVGLEALFRTSMKVYDNNHNDIDDNGINDTAGKDDQLYGTLVCVNHMNNAKSYRKWLRKTANETGSFLLLKQCYPNQDFTKRPIILVAVVGAQDAVQVLMKRWRTSRVDVDSKGKACLERQMTVLHEGTLDSGMTVVDHATDWDKACAEDQVNVSQEQLLGLIDAFGNEEWTLATKSLLLSCTEE
jgi:Protein of unknown function (DUF1115)